MTIPPITEVSYPFALAKKHPWMLFRRGGEYVAHRRPDIAKKKDGITVAFSDDIQDIPPDTRAFFHRTIEDMRNLAPDTARLEKPK